MPGRCHYGDKTSWFRRTSDITTLTAFVEDTIALLGLSVALVGIGASRVTGDPIFDSIGAIIIGVLLMLFAVALALENKRLILGESLPGEIESGLRAAIEARDGVAHVDDLRSMFVGAGRVLVTVDVSFDPETGDTDEQVVAIEDDMRERDDRIKLVYIEPN